MLKAAGVIHLKFLSIAVQLNEFDVLYIVTEIMMVIEEDCNWNEKVTCIKLHGSFSKRVYTF